jgi:Bacterial alpha-L-rhamnosidase 6 hairpin glycosidase domain/Alpha-L-rhamnosidase N-terminal domain/Bacterial alpha-L-rhamnosidase concanavalin-like domain/Bacterial alpha-L-rhamnosidase C-terminal domain
MHQGQMRFTWAILLSCTILVGQGAGASPDQSAMQVDYLRCEYLRDPMGIDATAPRLSWVLRSDQRGERQTAYQILVASSEEQLASDQGDLWDTGKVLSDETAQINYHGRPLASRQPCWWKVRAWNHADEPSAWSSPARWEIGLLRPEDWTAKWIEAAPYVPRAAFRLLHASFETTDGKVTKDVTAPLLDLVHDSALVAKVDSHTLGGDPAPFRRKLLRVTYEVAGETRDLIVPESSTLCIPGGPLPYLRKSFILPKPVRRARLYATALGIYELRLNGQRVGDHVLAPDWTDYTKRVRYQAYDVTALLKPGDNAVGALVANGWYSGNIGNDRFQFWGKVPALLTQLEITYADGSVERIVSDASWKTHESPMLESDFMLGESYDARQEIVGWDQATLDDSSWTSVPVRQESARPLEAQTMEPVRALKEIDAKSLAEPAPGRWTFDLGQNMVGVVRLNVAAPAGTKITLRHAEMLNPDGTLYTANLRGAPSIDTYVCRGDGIETWQPRFTFHGFRYVELTGLPDKPPLSAVTGIVLGSDTPRAGEFSCSDSRINQLQSNIQWGQRGNFLSVPTDCPQRNERLGWMGDAQIFIRTATCNADVAAFFTKWLVDVDDAQLSDGRFSNVSPNTGDGGGVPGWADAGVICPWTIYQVYGDKQELDRHWPAMVRWIEWCRSHSTDLVRDKDRGSDYGDWLSIKADTPKEVIGTAYFAYSTHLLAKAAAVLGKTDEAAKYEQLFEQIKAAFNEYFVAADGRIKGNTQTCYAMALKFDLLSDEMRSKASQYLDDDIQSKGGHVSSGFIGVSYLLPTLTQTGRVGTAFQLLMQDTFPSWLFSVKNGATTIWERWDGWTPDHGFQDPSMNSFNHYSLGSCGQWLFASVAGIDLDPDQSGFRHIIVRPQIGGGLTFAKGRYESIRGTIVSEWDSKNDQLAMHVVIPPNTTATIYVPTSDAAEVREGGKPIANSQDVHLQRADYDAKQGTAIFEVGSGTFDFTSPQ